MSVAQAALLSASLLLGACGAATGNSVTVGLQLVDVSIAELKSVEVLVLTGASCAKVLSPERPIDDPTVDVVAHGLFVADQSADAAPPRLHDLPLGPVVVYAEVFATPTGVAPRLARGCAEATIGRAALEIVVLIRKS